MATEDILEGRTYVGRVGKARTVHTLCQKVNGEKWLFWEVRGDNENRYQGPLKDFAEWALYEKS